MYAIIWFSDLIGSDGLAHDQLLCPLCRCVCVSVLYILYYGRPSLSAVTEWSSVCRSHAFVWPLSTVCDRFSDSRFGDVPIYRSALSVQWSLQWSVQCSGSSAQESASNRGSNKRNHNDNTRQ